MNALGTDVELPPGIAGFEPFLGSYGMTHVLAEEGIGHAHEPLRGLPAPPRPGGRDYVARVAGALHDLVDRYPVGHLLVPADIVLLRGLDAIPVPATVWLPPEAAIEVVDHFRRSVPSGVDVAVAPGLPRPRGTLPALVILGGLGGGLCHLPPASRLLTDIYQADQVLGISALIDPADPADCDRVRRLGWPSVWTSRFTIAYRPADDETPSRPHSPSGAGNDHGNFGPTRC